MNRLITNRCNVCDWQCEGYYGECPQCLADENKRLRERAEKAESAVKMPSLAVNQPCGCQLCVCPNDDKCGGCGAQSCHTEACVMIHHPENRVYDNDPTYQELRSRASFWHDLQKIAVMRAEKAEAACAEMRPFVERAANRLARLCADKTPVLSSIQASMEAELKKAQHALSTDCGQSWASPDTVAKWEKERAHCQQQAENWEHRADKLQAQVKAMAEALTAIVRSMPAIDDGGGLYYEHFDPDGTFVGAEPVDPIGLLCDWNQRANAALALVQERKS